MVQTAGTAGAQTAFMCALLAAFDMLAASPGVSFTTTLSPLQSFAWLTIAGLLGVLLAVPMRQHFIVDEKLTYADGVAAGETLIALDARADEGRKALRVLLIGMAASAAVMLLQQPLDGKPIPEVVWPTLFGLTWATMAMGVSTSLLNL